MEDRPRANDRLGSAEEVLDKEKIATAQDRLQRGHLALVRSTKIPSKRASSAGLPRLEKAEFAAPRRRLWGPVSGHHSPISGIPVACFRDQFDGPRPV
jgi:hypothetical protein